MANMPKRRKSKDNPYTLNYNDITNIYTVSFIDNKHVIHNIEVSKNVFDAFDEFELEDISQLHKMDKHYDNRNIDNSDYTDIMLFRLGKVNSKLVDEEVEEKLQNEELYKAINLLSETQKRRIKKYYFENKTLQQIANEECCSFASVKENIEAGISKLKKILKN